MELSWVKLFNPSTIALANKFVSVGELNLKSNNIVFCSAILFEGSMGILLEISSWVLFSVTLPEISSYKSWRHTGHTEL